MTAPDLASAAFRLALRGLAVFPLAEGSKVPLKSSNGFHSASIDADVARSRWTKHPRANIGVATGARSGVWILDVDRQHGGDKALAELSAAHGHLPLTVRVNTPGGGFHLWWRWPAAGPEIRNSAGRIGPGLDVRGEGGYVVVPPSRLSNGRRYSWTRGPVEILDAPDWLLELARPVAPAPMPSERKNVSASRHLDLDNYVATAVADELRQLARAGEGSRNDTLNRAAFAIAGFVKGGYLPHDWALAKLEEIAIDIGLPATEARRTIASAFLAAEPRRISA